MGIAERKEREKLEMQELILQTAAELFVTQGFEKTSMRNIAEAIEYSPATIYLYFKDKNELFYALQKEAFQKFFQYFQTVPKLKDPMQRLRRLGRIYIKFSFENPAYYDLMFIMREPMWAEATLDNWDEGQRSHQVLHDIIDGCMAKGHFKGRDPMIVAHLIWSFVHGLASIKVRERMRMFPDKSHKKIMKDSLETFSDFLEKM
ncbi:MAG: TetR/AcrR family transcriptional regulator [Cyclobacteriaceae bacterium]